MLSISLNVRPSVRVVTFEVPFKRLFAPTSRSRMSKILVSVSVLLSASVERCLVSRMRDFLLGFAIVVNLDGSQQMIQEKVDRMVPASMTVQSTDFRNLVTFYLNLNLRK